MFVSYHPNSDHLNHYNNHHITPHTSANHSKLSDHWNSSYYLQFTQITQSLQTLRLLESLRSLKSPITHMLRSLKSAAHKWLQKIQINQITLNSKHSDHWNHSKHPFALDLTTHGQALKCASLEYIIIIYYNYTLIS